MGRVREEADSTESAFSIKPYVGIFYKYEGLSPWILDFEFDYVLPQESYESMQPPKTESKRFIWSVNGNYYLGESLFGVLGMSTVVTKVTGEGGTIDISGRDYYLPTEPKESSHNMIINLGVGFDFIRTFYGELKTHIWRPFDSEARGVSVSMALKWRFLGNFGGGI